MSARKYFGTDGIRGTFGSAVMNPGFARSVGAALARFLRQENPGAASLCVLIGRDTRESGPVLLDALAEGLATGDVMVLDAGVVPTPAVALAVTETRADMGIAITASHNPAGDNGIKLFSSEALKLPDAVELDLEALIDTLEEAPPSFPEARIERFNAESGYRKRLSTVLPAGALEGWKIACDCANGATYRCTPGLLRELGADVEVIGERPNGTNINAGIGSEHPGPLQALVRETGAKIGIAHDGDGDRLLLCDETGDVVDGDEVLAMVGLQLLRDGRLNHKTLVATIMSNLGLDAAMEAAGGRVERVSVGDRYVLEAMLARGYNFGGEASGHIIFKDFSTTGDGLLAALQVLRLMRETGKPLSELRRVLTLFPQCKKNLRVKEKKALKNLPGWADAVGQIERTMQPGRVLVRYSGTEAKIRLLTEARDAQQAQDALDALEALVREHMEVVD